MSSQLSCRRSCRRSLLRSARESPLKSELSLVSLLFFTPLATSSTPCSSPDLPIYYSTSSSPHISPLVDQQLGGEWRLTRAHDSWGECTELQLTRCCSPNTFYTLCILTVAAQDASHFSPRLAQEDSDSTAPRTTSQFTGECCGAFQR